MNDQTMTTYVRADGEMWGGEYSFITDDEPIDDWTADEDDPVEVVREVWRLESRARRTYGWPGLCPTCGGDGVLLEGDGDYEGAGVHEVPCEACGCTCTAPEFSEEWTEEFAAVSAPTLRVLTELAERMEVEDERLRSASEHLNWGSNAYYQLEHQAEGIRLALSYVCEAIEQERAR